MKELIKYISIEINHKINELYNHRKDREGLVSAQNMLLNKLKIKVNEWEKEQYEKIERIKKLEKSI